jgi:uncharacterized protein (TIGR03437 family)
LTHAKRREIIFRNLKGLGEIRHMLRSVALGLLFVAAAWGQTRNDARRAVFPEVDVRELAASPEAVQSVQQSRAKALVERRTSDLEAFKTARAATQPGVRIVPNRHGLPKLFIRDGSALTVASPSDAGEIAKRFLVANSAAFPFTQTEVDQLRLTVRDAAPEATHLVFNQTLNGVDVFEGQIKFTLGKSGEVIQVGCGDVMPGLVLSTTPRIRPEDAEQEARASVRAETRGTVLRAPELVIFPVDASTARLSFRLFLEVDADQLYEMVIDAEDRKVLFRHNTYVFAGQARVWTQSPSTGTRQLVTFPDGWLPATGTVTTGNNVDAFVDADGNDKPDALNTDDVVGGRPSSATQTFDFAFGDGTLGVNPRTFKAAAATNLFYFVNIAHDFYYSLGFTETSGNLQTDNFGKGGSGNDAVIAEAQNARSSNNASFAPTPEGIPPRMRVGIFTRGTSTTADDLDSDYDGQIIMHEYGHGVSNRLVGGGTSTSCLNQIQSGGMGEGWSDYFAISFFNNAVIGGYSAQNTVRGLRRQSYEGYTFTYEDVGNAGYEVHDDGEIWAATLWDLRTSLGQAVTDRLVMNGLKGTPCNPSMTDARDAILSADLATNGGSHRAAIWTVFAKHGMGYSAKGIDGWAGSGTVYNAAYDAPPDLQSLRNPSITSNPLFTVSAGQPYVYAVQATNPNNGLLNFALSSGPVGMTVDSSAGAVNWISSFTGQRVKIAVTDGKGGKVVHGFLTRVFTNLSSGQSVTISGGEDSTGFGWIDVPAGTPVLQVTLRNGSGDADLMVSDPTGDFETSKRSGNNETLTFPNPKAGRWQVEVDGFQAYAQTSLTASLITPAPLSPNTQLTGLSGVISSETMYRVPVPAGASSFTVSTSGGTGDVDLFLKFGSPAACQASLEVTTACDSDKESIEDGNIESITVNNPAAGDWYIDLSGFDSFDGVSLTTALGMSPPVQPDLTISKTHPGNFAPGQIGAGYSITVTNAGLAATTGVVTVVDTLPAGLTATAISGSGWTCVLGTLTCTRSDALAAAASYSSITITVNVASSLTGLVTNTATVSGGGETNTTNDTARDVAAVTLSAPVITQVANAFGESPLIAPNTWIFIKGGNLATITRTWAEADFVNNQMPTQLDGVSVTVNGKKAYVYYISPVQINVLTPPDAMTGPVQVLVTFNSAVSNIATVQAQAQSLSFFEFPVGNLHYVIAQHLDATTIGPTSLSLVPAKPGEIIYVAANGFGPTGVPIVSGARTQTGNLPLPFPVVTVGGIPASVSFAGLVGPPGLFFIFFQVPSDAPDGDLSLAATYNGLSTQSNLLIPVRH